MYSKIIDQYLKEHKSNYKAKYVYHSCDRLDQNTFKFHYYVRDRQLLEINIFMTICLGETLDISIKENIHEHEQWAIACDALEKIRSYTNRKTSISVDEIDAFIEKKEIKCNTSPQDMIYILNHIVYHHGKNPDSVYRFYKIFIAYLKKRMSEEKYKEVLLAVNYLLENILNETIWNAFNIKYLDQEYTMHFAYLSSVLNILNQDFSVLNLHDHDLLRSVIYKTIQYWRFAFTQYFPLEKIVERHPKIMLQLFEEMEQDDIESSSEGTQLVFNILYSLATNDEIIHRQNLRDLMKLLFSDISGLANPEEQKEIGLHFLMMTGFDLLLEIFEETKDCYVYLCYPPSLIPVDFHPYIEKQLKEALRYYIGFVKDDKRRIEAVDQIARINALLIEYFDVY